MLITALGSAPLTLGVEDHWRSAVLSPAWLSLSSASNFISKLLAPSLFPWSILCPPSLGLAVSMVVCASPDWGMRGLDRVELVGGTGREQPSSVPAGVMSRA